MRPLPTINLAGTDFTIDVRLGELRNTEPPYNSIPFSNMDLAPDGYTYRFWYNLKDKGIHLAPVYVDQKPKELVCMQIPYEVKLDPVGIAQKHLLDLQNFLKRYPVQPELKGTIIDLEHNPSLRKRIINAFTTRKGLKR